MIAGCLFFVGNTYHTSKFKHHMKASPSSYHLPQSTDHLPPILKFILNTGFDNIGECLHSKEELCPGDCLTGRMGKSAPRAPKVPKPPKAPKTRTRTKTPPSSPLRQSFAGAANKDTLQAEQVNKSHQSGFVTYVRSSMSSNNRHR